MKGEAKFFASLKETSEKRHKKPLGKARKSGAEGESLKLLKESSAIIAEFLFLKSVSCFRNMLPSFPCPTCGCEQGWHSRVLLKAP